MKSTPAAGLVTLLLFTGCSKPTPSNPRLEVSLPPRLDSYFESYCDYTGSLGIGFDPSHTYDYRFRQRLKTTEDLELKRLFVLYNLHRDVEFALDDFEKGIVQTGKASSRPLTLSEWQSTRSTIQTQIDDLASYAAFTNFVSVGRDLLDSNDQRLDAKWIDDLRRRLGSVTNTPTATHAIEQNGE